MVPATPLRREILVRVVFHLADGRTQVVAATPGDSVMDCAVDHAVPGIHGQCGGGCTCGTCHCYVALPWSARVPPADPDELELLEHLPDRRAESRLACRIVLDDALDGIELSIAPSNGAPSNG